MRIRKARKEDYRKISNLRKKTFKKINAKDYTKGQIAQIYRKTPPRLVLKKMKDGDIFCLVEGDKILGVIDIEGDKIGGFFVRYDLTKKGLGDKLLTFLESHAKKKGIKKVKLNSTEYAYSFYLKRGYRLIEKKSSSELGIRNYKMEKNIK